MNNFIIRIILYILVTSAFICSQSDNNQYIEITTKDGNIFLGTLIEETEDFYKIITRDGIEINVPKSSVKEIGYIEVSQYDGEIFRPDPNKSMYLFVPSAYPIEHDKAYVRDFQIFFPSYNRGIGNNISIQAGAITIPGMSVEYLPIILSAKYSFPKSNTLQFATGALYSTLPFSEISGGVGIAFATATYGNLFNHFSSCLGWGYIQLDGDFEFMEDPILVFAGNRRISNRLALTFEFWKFPEVEISYSPLVLATRFIGRKFSVDVGAGLILEMEGIPIPMLNFTYHI